MTSLMFGSYSTLWLMFSALYVFLVDRRFSARKIVLWAIVVHIFFIAFHYLIPASDLSKLMMVIEAVFAYRVSVSEFALRKTFVLLLSCSVCLSLLWGWDLSNGCNFLCNGEEPSNYRIISGMFTILSGVVFIGSEHIAERNGATYSDLFRFRGYHRRGGR